MPALCQNLEGKIFGRWTIIESVEKPIHIRGRNRSNYYLCKCECGTERVVNSYNLISGISKSCGCYHLDKCQQSIGKDNVNFKHGLAKTREYKIWVGLKNRCLNKKSENYSNYGGRGIHVCDEWLDSFDKFIADMGPRPSKKHQIERVDNDGPYSPENCIWALPLTQSNNKRNNRFVEFNGQSKTLAEWARKYSIPSDTLSYRIKIGWTMKDALTRPVKKRKNNRNTEIQRIAGV